MSGFYDGMTCYCCYKDEVICIGINHYKCQACGESFDTDFESIREGLEYQNDLDD